MDYAGRMLLEQESSQDTAPFFGFIGAASALVFSCAWATSQLGRVLGPHQARLRAL